MSNLSGGSDIGCDSPLTMTLAVKNQKKGGPKMWEYWEYVYNHPYLDPRRARLGFRRELNPALAWEILEYAAIRYYSGFSL